MEFNSYYLLALRYLTIRPRSEKEMRDYLSRHSGKRSASRIKDGSWTSPSTMSSGQNGQDDNINQMVDLVIHKLKEQKFLNDEEFARMWVRSRTDFKPKGWRLIKLELKQKGISEEILERLAQGMKSKEASKRDELALAKEILERKRKKFEPMERQERFMKAGSLLARRGFNLDDIKKAIEEVFGK